MPARLTYEQAAWVLNFSVYEIPILVKARLLKPLGNPPSNGVKYFATVEIEQHAKDPQWLAKATNAIYTHWNTKNHRKNGRQPSFHSRLCVRPLAARTQPNTQVTSP